MYVLAKNGTDIHHHFFYQMIGKYIIIIFSYFCIEYTIFILIFDLWNNQYVIFLCRWKMHFIRSEFRGLLPGRYTPESLSNVVENFNDQNKEELDKYVSIINLFEKYKSNEFWFLPSSTLLIAGV